MFIQCISLCPSTLCVVNPLSCLKNTDRQSVCHGQFGCTLSFCLDLDKGRLLTPEKTLYPSWS